MRRVLSALLWACVLSLGPLGSSTAAIPPRRLLQDAGAYALTASRGWWASRVGVYPTAPGCGTCTRGGGRFRLRRCGLSLMRARPLLVALRHAQVGWATLGCMA